MKLTPYGHRPNALTGRIDMLLYRGEHTFREIADILDCPLSKLSAHMDKLRKMGFIVRVDRRTMKIRVQKITVVRNNEVNMIEEETRTPQPTLATDLKFSPNGHRVTSIPGRIDVTMWQFKDNVGRWPSAIEVAESTGIAVSRVSSHINYWKNRGRYAD